MAAGFTASTRTFAGSVLLFPKLLVGFSLGLFTEAVFVYVPAVEVTVARAVIGGNEAPTASASVRVHLNPTPSRVQFHPDPVGTHWRARSALNVLSVTVVTFETGLGPLFVTTKV